MKKHTLSGGIALLLGAATVLLLGAAAVLMDSLVDAEMRRRFDVDLLGQARALAALVENSSNLEGAANFGTRILASHAQGSYVVRCAGGSDLQSAPPATPVPAGWLQDGAAQPRFADVAGGARAQRAVWFAFVPTTADGVNEPHADTCRLLFMQSRQSLDESLLIIDVILLVIPLLALLLVLALSPFLVRRGLRPLTRLRESMRGIGPQQPGQRLQATGTVELEPLVTSFNEVLMRMDEVLARERHFTDALAHETRTRLAELRTLVEVERRYPSGRTVDSLLGEISAISGEMEGTVSSLLLLTRLDAGQEHADWQPLDLRAVIERHQARVATTAQRRQLRIELEAPDGPVTLMADAALLDIVLGNLLANACEYAPVGSTVCMIWKDDTLTVRNTAPDLGADEVDCLGQRFWSKQHGRGGHAGLGLALAGAAAASMGFRLAFVLNRGHQLAATLDCRHPPELPM